MRERAYADVVAIYNNQIRKHKLAIQQLEANQAESLRLLEKDCLAQHGTHQKDSVFHGFCIRCGAYLG